jgi:hypothetical protein
MSGSALEGIDRRIGELDAAVQHMGDNLVALDEDVTRQMLEASTALTGRTAQAWGLGDQQIAEVWRGQVALRDHLVTITEIRGTKANVSKATLGRLNNLLDGEAVTVADPDNVKGQRSLTTGENPTFVCTIAQLIEQMSAGYDSVMALLSAVGTAWTEALPRLAELETQVERLEAAVSATGARPPNDLARARRELSEAQAVALGDPLSLSTDMLASINAMVDQLIASVRAAVASQQEAADQVAALANSLAACSGELERARAQGERVAERVILPSSFWSALEQGEAELSACRQEFDSLTGQPTAYTSERPRITHIDGRTRSLEERVSKLATEAALGLAAREELRGRLDAYRAKSQAIGMGEDAALDALYEAASSLLFVAPCDLDLAEEAVRSFQSAVRDQKVGSD